MAATNFDADFPFAGVAECVAFCTAAGPSCVASCEASHMPATVVDGGKLVVTLILLLLSGMFSGLTLGLLRIVSLLAFRKGWASRRGRWKRSFSLLLRLRLLLLRPRGRGGINGHGARFIFKIHLGFGGIFGVWADEAYSSSRVSFVAPGL